MGGVLLVGEQPNGTPGPDGPLGGRSAARLAALAGVDVSWVLAQRRTNLIPYAGSWDAEEARVEAKRLDVEGPPVEFVLLGRRVAAAFGLSHVRAFTHLRLDSGRPAVLLPYPSGRCRLWNDPTNREIARRILARLL